MMGNEAIAIGALEGGVSYCSGYPGNPSSEIIETLLSKKNKHDIVVEWSINEIVALEAAAAFSFTGLRSMVTMKQNGINVCFDFLQTVSQNELKGGLLVVVCDDPGPLSSSNEEDSRHFARIAQIPLLEPSTPQEAKDMTSWLLDFSSRIGVPCMLRSVSRLSHGRGSVLIKEVPKNKKTPVFDTSNPLVGQPHLVAINRSILMRKMKKVQEEFDQSPFNNYEGPENAPFLIIATGMGALYAKEAVDILGLDGKIGILKIGTSWPLPAGLLRHHLRHAREVLFVEETDPFIEEHVKAFYAGERNDKEKIRFYGKHTGEVAGLYGPGVGEVNTDIICDALRQIHKLEAHKNTTYEKKAIELAQRLLVQRELSFCPGCPHRASFWAIKVALDLDGRDGFVVGDIGCYGMANGATGFNQVKTLHCMGSGMGHISGFDKLKDFGFNQPVVAVAGDSTFYHAGIPALINAKFNNATALFIILDNGVTAMTGFQINPASCFVPLSEPLNPIPIEELTRGLGIQTTVLDPVEDINKAIETIYDGLQKEDGVRVIIFRHICSTYENKIVKERLRYAIVDEKKCIGEKCGCDRFCSRILNCPSIQYDYTNEKAYIDETCIGCGLCSQLCPQGAIRIVEKGEKSKG